MKSIILMGIKHCGKSTQGKLLGEMLELPFFDTDSLISGRTGRTPRQIYLEGGEDAFKDAELDACTALAEQIRASGTDAVIATGGGICANPAALAALRPLGSFVFLQADEQIAANRIVREVSVAADGTLSNLPAYIAAGHPQSLSDVRREFHRFYLERTSLYAAAADVTVQMLRLPKQENARRIMQALRPE